MRRNILRSYQSVLIVKPDLDEAQVDQVLEKITEFLSKNNGSIVKVEKWGKKRLAYRINKSRFGYYLNIYHTCESIGVSALESSYKLYDLVLKFLVIRMADKEFKLAIERDYDAESEDKKGLPAKEDKKGLPAKEEQKGLPT
jgi:small subunit ribosomal protein S6